MRFSFPSRNELARVETAFDMTPLEPFIEDIVFYDDDPAIVREIHKNDVTYDCRKFVAIVDANGFYSREWVDKAVELDDGFPGVTGGLKQRRKK